MGFSDLKLHKELIKVLEENRIFKPTEIQKCTFPAASNGHDIIGISQTGSGKTLGFLLPLLHQIMLSDKPFHSLIIAPTRELSQQIGDTLKLFLF